VVYSYDRYFKELHGAVRSTNPRFVAILVPADSLEGFPQIRSTGGPDNMTIEVQAQPRSVDRITLTRDQVGFVRETVCAAAFWQCDNGLKR